MFLQNNFIKITKIIDKFIIYQVRINYSGKQISNQSFNQLVNQMARVY